MRIMKFFGAAVALTIFAVVCAHQTNHGSHALILAGTPAPVSAAAKINKAAGNKIPAESIAVNSCRLDASQSKFIAHAMAGRLFWFKGHDHLVAVQEFSGEARL